MKRITIYLMIAILSISSVYGIDIDAYETAGSEDSFTYGYPCETGNSGGQAFNMSVGLSIGDNISVEMKCATQIVGLDVGTVYNLTILEADGNGEPTGTITYATRLVTGDLFPDATAWCGTNLTMTVLADMTEGDKYLWGIVTVSGDAGDILAFRADRAASGWHTPSYTTLKNQACDVWDLVEFEQGDNDVLLYRVSGELAPALDTTPPVLSNINISSTPDGDTTEPYNASGILIPTFEFDTDEAADCDISDDNSSNWGACSTTGGQAHICRILFEHKLTFYSDKVYSNCTDSLGNSNYDEWEVWTSDFPFIAYGTMVLFEGAAVFRECT